MSIVKKMDLRNDPEGNGRVLEGATSLKGFPRSGTRMGDYRATNLIHQWKRKGVSLWFFLGFHFPFFASLTNEFTVTTQRRTKPFSRVGK